MSIVGNMAGCYSPIGKTFIIEDADGNSMTGVITEQQTLFTANAAEDIREGKVAATDAGIVTGSAVVPNYHTTEAVRYIPDGSAFTIPLSTLDSYKYTKLQVIICSYNTSVTDSVSAQKISILDKVYDVNSTTELATVIKDDDNKAIDLGIINDSGSPCLLRYFTYKELY